MTPSPPPAAFVSASRATTAPSVRSTATPPTSDSTVAVNANVSMGGSVIQLRVHVLVLMASMEAGTNYFLKTLN